MTSAITRLAPQARLRAMLTLPPDLAAALHTPTWPDDPAARALLVDSTHARPEIRRELVRWAHGVASLSQSPPTIDAWAAVLGVPRLRLDGARGYRARYAADLETPPRTYPRRPAEEITAGSRKLRAARDRARTRQGKPGRRSKTSA